MMASSKNSRQFDKFIIALKDLPAGISKRMAVGVKRNVKDIILNEILSGKSPVKGKTFKKYSPGYSKLKGREKPVDLFLTGTMLESLKINKIKKSQVRLSFTDKKARWHNRGEGNNPVRRIMPRKGEVFKTKIMAKIIREFKKAMKDIIKKRIDKAKT